MTKKLSTNDIFAKIEKGEPVDVKEVEFVSPDTMRDKLYAKITEMPSSINHFADLCGIYPSHLHEFLKGTKNLGRDKLIIVCIVLKLNLRETREVLKCTLDCLRQWNFGLYVSGFWHIHAKTPRGIVVCEQ